MMTDSSFLYTFTVFTPTYNRAHTLDRVYESLKAQTYRNFEWLIVDDGSTDETQSHAEQWQRESDFPIRYFYQENGGKHIAFNRGIKEAQGELFLTFDSDDSCVPHALERFKLHWDTIRGERKENFSGVTCLCQDQQGRIVGDHFPFDPTDSDTLELVYRYKVKGEKQGFHLTQVLRQYPFPESPKKTYVPEGVIWRQIARTYKTRFVNEALRIYWMDGPSLMRQASLSYQAVGGRISYLNVLNEDMMWFWSAPIHFARIATHYARFSFHTSTSIAVQWRSIHSKMGRFLYGTAVGFGYCLYKNDRRREMFRQRQLTIKES